MNIDLSGKRAVVCGSTQGIGKACAEELATLGATVCLVARNPDKLDDVRKTLNTDSGQIHDFIAVDFSQPDVLKEKITAYLGKQRTAHILVNNTGGPPGGSVFEAAPEEFVQGFSNHVVCNQILVQAVVPGMKKAGYGRIINIISTSVKQPLPALGVSNTIRGAVASWAKTLANELGVFGITVNNVLPGATKTGRLDSLIQTKADHSGKTVQQVTEQLISLIPAGRFGEPQELANAVAFLASPAAGYINGINLPVDGGRTKCL